MIEAVDLDYSYPGSAPVITRFSNTFERGEMVAITGASGRGKSTLLYVLGLMLRPSSGAVLIDGVNCSTASDAERARLRATQFGFVFQDAALDPTRTVMDNVVEGALYRDASRRAEIRRADELLERFGVALRRDARPGEVSGGQAQRIALCRALVGQPSILLADEPTGNLDQETSSVVVAAFRDQANSGNSVVVVTHDVHVAAACDRQVAL